MHGSHWEVDVLRKVVLLHAQLVGDSSVKVATQPVQVEASEQEAQ